MNPFNEITIFRLIQCNQEELVVLNSGYIGNKTIGWFHMMGYQPVTGELLIQKPVIKGRAFVVTQEYYKKHCVELLNFKLYNN